MTTVEELFAAAVADYAEHVNPGAASVLFSRTLGGYGVADVGCPGTAGVSRAWLVFDEREWRIVAAGSGTVDFELAGIPTFMVHALIGADA